MDSLQHLPVCSLVRHCMPRLGLCGEEVRGLPSLLGLVPGWSEAKAAARCWGAAALVGLHDHLRTSASSSSVEQALSNGLAVFKARLVSLSSGHAQLALLEFTCGLRLYTSATKVKRRKSPGKLAKVQQNNPTSRPGFRLKVRAKSVAAVGTPGLETRGSAASSSTDPWTPPQRPPPFSGRPSSQKAERSRAAPPSKRARLGTAPEDAWKDP